MSIGDNELYASQAATHEASQEVRSERFRPRGADSHGQDFTTTVGIHGYGDNYGDRDDTPRLLYLDLGGVDPEIGPVAFSERSRKTGSSISRASRDTRLLEVPVTSIVLTRSPIERVETP